MSDYGADKNPDLNIARQLMYAFGLMPLDDANVMQWTYDNDTMVQKYADRKTASNVLFLLVNPLP